MFRFLIPFLLFFVSVFSFAQQAKKKATKPPYRYIYGITKEQIWKINAGKYKEVYTKEFLSKPVDSLTILQDIPAVYKKGRYIILSPEEKYLSEHIIKSNRHFMTIIETPEEMGVVIKNVADQSITDVRFYIEEKSIQLRHNGFYYVIPREMYGKKLLAEYKDELLFIQIPKSISKEKYSSKINKRRGSEGFVLTDKPKYHIGDTVFMKAYFSPSLFSKKTKFKISYSEKNKKAIVFEDEIKKDESGSYISYFVLSDTLPIDLVYQVRIDQKNRGRLTYFRIEDYKLDDFLLNAAIQFDEKYQDSITVDISCTTPQGDPISGWIYLNMEPGTIDVSADGQTYMPYWSLKDSIQTNGQTNITYKTKMPALPYGEYEMNLTLQVKNNGLIEEVKKEVVYSYQPVVMLHKLQEHVCIFNSYAVASSSPTTDFAIYGSLYNRDTVPISFPYEVDLQKQKIPSAFLIGQSYIKVDLMEIMKEPLDFDYAVQQNAIQVHIYNPLQLPLTVTGKEGEALYQKNEAAISFKIPLEKNQLLYCEYLYLGKYFQKRLLISPDYKSLVIEAILPDTIAPGQSVQANVHVSDIKDKPLRNVNLTVLAVDNRLKHTGIPASKELIQYEYEMLTDNQSNSDSYTSTSIPDTSILANVYEEYSRFIYTDSINYFLVPEIDDALTEAFIYVQKKGVTIRPGYVFEDGKPVYWSNKNEISMQSFYTTPGYHSYEIRLPDEMVYIDSVFIYAAFKNNILIPIDRIPKGRYRIASRPKRLTKDEIERLYPYLYTIKTSKGCALETRANFYSHVSHNTIIVNEDARIHFISDSAGVAVHCSDSVSNKKYYESYLKRQRFIKLTSDRSEIQMSELKTLERQNYIIENTSCDFDAIRVALGERDSFADLYVRYQFYFKTISKLIGDAGVVQIDSNRRTYGVDILLFKIAAPGKYRIQFWDLAGTLVQEQEIYIDKPGYYFSEIFSKACTKTTEERSDADLYSNERLYYPTATMSYRSKYASSYRRSRRYRLTYAGVYGGLNSMYTQAHTMSQGYQIGAIVGKEFSRRMSTELRLSYGNIALSAPKSYQYSYGKIGAMVWYTLPPFGYSRFSMSLGSGVAGQRRFDVSSNNSAAMIPVGVSVKYGIPYAESVRLEVLWNKTVAGTDYSYSNQGIWEINLRINFSLQRRRVICPSNFWGGESDKRAKSNDSYLLLSSSTTTNRAYSDTTIVVSNYVKQSATQNENVTYEKMRSDFYDRAYWIPSFKTDVNGNAVFNARYPDALTHWDNYIIAYNKRRQSNTWLSQNTAYLKNYVQLYVPRFVIAGDSASASYHVESDKPFSIRNTVGNTTIGESNTVDGKYAFYATETADTISCRSVLFIDDKQIDGEQRLIPVYRAGNETYTGFYTYLSGDTILNVSKPDSVLETKIYLSNDLEDLVRIQYKQLMEYSYSCNEQTASKLIGSIVGKQLNGTYSGKQPQSFYHKLKLNANADGLYSWWGGGMPNVSMSAYVLYALKQYYTSAGIKPDPFYARLQRQLVESAAYYKASYFTYWLMKESNLSMDAVELASPEARNYQEEILKLRIRQLQGDTIQRTEIETYLERTILGNVALVGSVQFEAAWYEHDALYLIILHRIAKSNYPDLAERIRKGLVEHGCLSEYTPTYVKALFIEEFAQLNLIPKNAAAVTYDNIGVTDFPFEKVIKDNNSHVVKIDDAAGMYVVKSEKQIRTNALKYKGIDIEYSFEKDGNKISALQSGTVVDQVVRLNISENCSYVMVEIPMAAGCIIEDVIVPGSAMLTHREIFRDKVILYFTKLPKGTYIVHIRQKVLFKGNYQLNPCSVNLMYFPMIQTQTAVRRIKIN
jgi:hypothetical protein